MQDIPNQAARSAMPDWVPDLATMGRDDLDQLVAGAAAERDRRDAVEGAEQRMVAAAEQIRVEYRQAVDEQPADGDPAWSQPHGDYDAYPEGWRVEHDGHTWRSLTPGNVWEPGVSGWRIVPADGETAPYVPVSGAHDAYSRGDVVEADGQVWDCAADVCAHAPGVQGSGWTARQPDPEPDVDPEPPVPEEPTDPPPIDTNSPDPWSEGQVYAVDDLCTWEGATYRCRQAHTAVAGWTPSAVPALWEEATA